MRQIPLGVRLADTSAFGNFLASDGNREALDAVRGLAAGQYARLCLVGAAGSGKSHLLQAACRELASGRPSYLPLDDLTEFGAEVFEGLEANALICLDEVQSLAGDPRRETALFVALDAWRATGCSLLVAMPRRPQAAGFAMPELVSRLDQLQRVVIEPLDDSGKATALRQRARARGFELGEEELAYLLTRHGRATAELFALLERIDVHSLTHQRRVTVPLLRELLAGASRKS
ncbi:MAG: DnaA regulatory inactivator Hda [Gammaproteobacteria bacterium]|jgi:DnaA family protein|nr:DnaA regulatory inactivator Hda [Gammaproteobacteria bacterium]